MASVELVDTAHPVEVFAKEFGDGSIDLLVRWWAGSTPVQAHASRDKVVGAIKRALDVAGMAIPFPQRTLWFREPLKVGRDGNDAEAPGSKP